MIKEKQAEKKEVKKEEEKVVLPINNEENKN